MTAIEFSREVLLEIRDQQLDIFKWSFKNLLEQTKGTNGFLRWARYCLHAINQFIKLDEQSEHAKSEYDR